MAPIVPVAFFNASLVPDIVPLMSTAQRALVPSNVVPLNRHAEHALSMPNIFLLAGFNVGIDDASNSVLACIISDQNEDMDVIVETTMGEVFNLTELWNGANEEGLGTSTSEEFEDYFAHIDSHTKLFMPTNMEDEKAIEKAFSMNTEDRKLWILEPKQLEPEELKPNKRRIGDFVDKELILYSLANIRRSIPSVFDGLKPSQRKVLFSAFKKEFFEEEKVFHLSAYVSLLCAYHHGHENIDDTIIRMAQNHIGSNNINLLEPEGQFGKKNMLCDTCCLLFYLCYC